MCRMLLHRWGSDTRAGTHEGNAYSQNRLHLVITPDHFHHQKSLLTHSRLPLRSLIHDCLAQAGLTIIVKVAVIMQVERHWLQHHSHSLKCLIVKERAEPALCAPPPTPPSSLPLPAWQVLYCLSVY